MICTSYSKLLRILLCYISICHFQNISAQAENLFPIMASHALGNRDGTVKNYETIEEAGFTLSIAYLESREEVIRHLEAASKTSVKLIVWCPELVTDPEGTIKIFKKYSSLGGYYLSDEPDLASFTRISVEYKRIKQVDNRHHIWINIYPNYATKKQLGTNSYENYINKYIGYINPRFVSFDHYGLKEKGLRSGYFENLEIVSERCRFYGKPFWAYVLSAEFDDYLRPTKATLSFQAYSNIAYGAQGIEYYTYKKGRYKSAIVDNSYQRMPLYYSVKELNTEINYYSKYFINNTINDVTHLGREVPRGTKRAKIKMQGISLISYSGKGFVISQFSNGHRQYIMFVNRDYEKPQEISIFSKDIVTRLSYYKEERWQGAGRQSFVAKPGSIILLQL